MSDEPRLTRPFIETVRERAARDPELRAELLRVAIEAEKSGDHAEAAILFRDWMDVIGAEARIKVFEVLLAMEGQDGAF